MKNISARETTLERRIYLRGQGRWRACGTKRRFPSKRNAAARARVIGGGMGAYKCVVCRHWHVGHSRVA